MFYFLLIVHRDIKPANILLCRTKQRDNVRVIAKVADFGLSRELPNGESGVESSSTSTTAYMAQECYEKIWVNMLDIFVRGSHDG